MHQSVGLAPSCSIWSPHTGAAIRAVHDELNVLLSAPRYICDHFRRVEWVPYGPCSPPEAATGHCLHSSSPWIPARCTETQAGGRGSPPGTLVAHRQHMHDCSPVGANSFRKHGNAPLHHLQVFHGGLRSRHSSCRLHFVPVRSTVQGHSHGWVQALTLVPTLPPRPCISAV